MIYGVAPAQGIDVKKCQGLLAFEELEARDVS